MFDGELSVLLGQSKVAPYTIGGKSKRIFDVLIASITLIMFLPLFAFVVLLLKLTDPWPSHFPAYSCWPGGRRFACFKFRSMVLDSDKVLKAFLESDPAARKEWDRTQKLANDPRITPVGKFLRQSSLDELPQLINVIRGDMSLVGPRPIVPSELTRYGDRLVCIFWPGPA